MFPFSVVIRKHAYKVRGLPLLLFQIFPGLVRPSFVFQIDDIVKAVGNCSYNQLVEKIISCKQSDNSQLVSEGR